MTSGQREEQNWKIMKKMTLNEYAQYMHHGSAVLETRNSQSYTVRNEEGQRMRVKEHPFRSGLASVKSPAQ